MLTTSQKKQQEKRRNTLRVLLRVRRLIGVHQRWCKHQEALNSRGQAVYGGLAESSGGVAEAQPARHCLLGALDRAVCELNSYHLRPDVYVYLRRAVRGPGTARKSQIDSVSLSGFNDDDRTHHKDVLSVVNRAIGAARQQSRAKRNKPSVNR